MAKLRAEEIETREMSRLFVAWKPISGARITGSTVSGIKTSISLSKMMSFWTFVCARWKLVKLGSIFPGGLMNRCKKPSSKKI